MTSALVGSEGRNALSTVCFRLALQLWPFVTDTCWRSVGRAMTAASTARPACARPCLCRLSAVGSHRLCRHFVLNVDSSRAHSVPSDIVIDFLCMRPYNVAEHCRLLAHLLDLHTLYQSHIRSANSCKPRRARLVLYGSVLHHQPPGGWPRTVVTRASPSRTCYPIHYSASRWNDLRMPLRHN